MVWLDTIPVSRHEECGEVRKSRQTHKYLWVANFWTLDLLDRIQCPIRIYWPAGLLRLLSGFWDNYPSSLRV